MWCNTDAELSTCVRVCVFVLSDSKWVRSWESVLIWACFQSFFFQHGGNYRFSIEGNPSQLEPCYLLIFACVRVWQCVRVDKSMCVCLHAHRCVCTCACVSEWQGCYLCHHTWMCVLIENAPRCHCLCLPRTYICMKPCACVCVCVCVHGGGLLITRFLSWICMAASFIMGWA